MEWNVQPPAPAPDLDASIDPSPLATDNSPEASTPSESTWSDDGAIPNDPNDAAVDADSAVDSGHDASADAGDDAAPDAGDAAVDSGNGDCAPARCDCDNDGFNDLTRAGCAGAGGPQDCDDHDPRAQPNQTFIEDPPTSPLNGDWNCKNGVEKLYPSNVSCGLLGLTGCAGVQGFKDDPACGAEGSYMFCVVNGLFCAEGSKSTRRQACK